MSEKHLLAKIAKLELKHQEISAEKRQLSQRVRDLTVSRDVWKSKYQDLKIDLPLTRASDSGHKTAFEFRAPRISGHKFDLNLVYMSLSLYFMAGCSLRGVKRVLLCFQLEYGLFSCDLPSKSTINNWIEKVGYDDYTHCNKDLYVGDYAIIIDESMVIGQQRMMVILGLPAVKTTDKASDLGTVRLLYLAVRSTWKAPDVVVLLKNLAQKMGKVPLYAISDGGNNLKKGLKDSQLVRVCDVGHEIAKCVEQTYKHQEVFKAFSTDVAGVKFREIMKDTAYLLPPKQRAIARFMNLSDTVDWAINMLRVLPKLTQVEQQTFNFLRGYESLIKELEHVFEMVHKMLKIIKNEGISQGNIGKCTILMQQYITKIPPVLATKMTTYFKNEAGKITDKHTLWHASSDVIESLFGKYKQRAASNKLNGVTSLVLSLGLYSQFQEPNDQIKENTKKALQEVSMADLRTWKQAYLIKNQVVRRRKVFKK
jgi:hypothetical protein